MKVSVEKIYGKSSQIIFLIYLPLTFFIWYFMLNGIGGGVTLILVLSVFLFLISFLKYQKIDHNFVIFSFVIFCCLFYALAYYAFQGEVVDKNGRSLLIYHIVGIVLYITSYLVGRNFVKINDNIFIFLFLIMFIRVILSADLTLLSIDLTTTSDSLKGLYLGLSDIFCIFSLLIIGCIKSDWWKLIIFLLSVVALFILNSRASLYIYIVSVLFYFILFFRINKILILFLLLFLLLISYFSKLVSLFSENNRMFALLLLNDNDQSSQERALFQKNGINQILDNVIFGDYGGVVRIYNDLGAYIHNILSYWQTYGLLVFLICFYFMVFQTFYAGFTSFKLRKFKEYHYIFTLSVYLFITILFARSYNWYFAWFIVGLVHQFLYIHRDKLKNTEAI